jgi:hypothetical protein
MTEAVNTVKKKQTELAIPDFRSEGDFVVATNKTPTRTPDKINKKKIVLGSDRDRDEIIDNAKNIDLERLFSDVLFELSKLYGKFPKYMLEIMADNYGIPALELKLLTKIFKKRGIISVLKNENFYYQVELKLLSDLRTKD